MQSSRLGLATAVILLLGIVLSSNARAVEFTGRFSTWVAPENPKCTCRYKGEHLPLGALRCLQTPNGPRMHECVTVQNVTSWQPGKEPCPQASLTGPQV